MRPIMTPRAGEAGLVQTALLPVLAALAVLAAIGVALGLLATAPLRAQETVTAPAGFVPKSAACQTGADGKAVCRPPAPVAGQITLTAGARACLPAAGLVNGLVIKAASSNASTVLLGGVTVTVTQDGTGNGYPVAAGEAMSFALADASALCAISTAPAVIFYGGN